LYVGRLVDVKGVDLLIRAVPGAARKLPFSLALTVAGDGPDRKSLAELARKLDVNAEFIGWLDGPEKLKAMQQADLLVVPSRWPEPFGLVGIEAGCLGLPAVGFAVGGIQDWLIPGVSGELAPGDPPTRTGLADAIVRALSSPDHYKRLCLGARQVAQGFKLDKHVNELEAIFGCLTQTTVPADWKNCGQSLAEA
jgi:glycosyltransferase involved in cell wall biosynthesis